MKTPLTVEALLVVLGLAAVAAAVLGACVLLSLELRWIAPMWVPWALAALSFGLGVLSTRAVALARQTRALPDPDAELDARIAVEAELAVLRLNREQTARARV